MSFLDRFKKTGTNDQNMDLDVEALEAAADESMVEVLWRRYSKHIIIGLVVVLVTVIGSALFWPRNDESRNNVAPKFTVSDTDRNSLVETTKGFVRTSGKWGVDSDKVTDTNVRDIYYLLATRASGYRNFVIARTDAYESVKPLIYPGSSVDYDATTLRSWERDSSVVDAYLPSFEVSRVEVKVPREGHYMAMNGENVERLGVEVTWDSRETIRVLRATDAASDGSFGIYEKNFKNNKATIWYVKKDGKWLVHSMEGDNKFLLVPFGVVDYEQYYFTQLEDFSDTGLSLHPKTAPGQDADKKKPEENPDLGKGEEPKPEETPSATPSPTPEPTKTEDTKQPNTGGDTNTTPSSNGLFTREPPRFTVTPKPNK